MTKAGQNIFIVISWPLKLLCLSFPYYILIPQKINKNIILKGRTEYAFNLKIQIAFFSELEKERREEALSKPLDESSKGFALLAKMGFKPGMSLGKKKDGEFFRKLIILQILHNTSYFYRKIYSWES